jgi:hypothetical protein
MCTVRLPGGISCVAASDLKLVTKSDSKPFAEVSTYTLKTQNGRHIRQATKVTYSDGREVKFVDKLPKKEALRQTAAQIARDASRN